MNFCGYDFLKDADAFSPNFQDKLLAGVTISNGVYDEIYLTKDPDEYLQDTDDWNDNTLIFVDFNNQSTSGGNMPYVLSNIAYFRLKRREVGTFEWTGLYEHYFTDINDINFEYVDRYAKGNDTEYEYCIAPVSSEGIEQTYNTVKVISKFDGAVICDRNISYHILLEPTVDSVTRNREGTIIVTMNNKYPFVFYGSNANYYSGEFSGVAIDYDIDGGLNNFWFPDKSVDYRDKMVDWLTNGEPKILKMFDGRIWMVNINGNVTLDNSDHYRKVAVSFEFVEIGDPSSTDDLYNNNFVDYNTEELGVQ